MWAVGLCGSYEDMTTATASTSVHACRYCSPFVPVQRSFCVVFAHSDALCSHGVCVYVVCGGCAPGAVQAHFLSSSCWWHVAQHLEPSWLWCAVGRAWCLSCWMDQSYR